MEIREIFENLIKIEQKVMSIESLFNSPERVENTNFRPSYQRNYVWDDEKATYFIESILLGTEIPPLIYFRNGDMVEVIDGRQRYETILRFIRNDFKLKKGGLQKLENIGIVNRLFKDIGEKMTDLFWDTKLRIIEFSFHTKSLIDDEIEEVVKKEIFKRYNSGITPLKPTEIDKAAYFEDDLNSYIKSQLQKDAILYADVSGLLHFEKTNLEIILKKIRQLLVQHYIPIKYYSNKKDTVAKYYDFLFFNIDSGEIPDLYQRFIQKINLLKKIKGEFAKNNSAYNRLITECLFWMFSILESEKVPLTMITDSLIRDLVHFLIDHLDAFNIDRSSFAKELVNRYLITADFFSRHFQIDFQIYLQYNQEFKQKNKALNPKDIAGTSFDELRINKPEPSTTAIIDICRQMSRQRFLIRPPYQRNEVINKKKSSSIIESILLGIKLPPIFVFKRDDGISEVLDGQQRLLSILGFIGEPYIDETGNSRYSDKNNYSLNLKNGILKNLNSKNFTQLVLELKNRIRNFDLWIIEINQKNNVNFEPIDLFIRLNNKPYPIKEDTFEMWNSYISRDIIETIKALHKNNEGWFYLRKNNSRMEDENMYTALAYFQYTLNNTDEKNIYEAKELDIYKNLDKISLRVKSKIEISKILENADYKESFIQACNELEFNFIHKVKTLLSSHDYEFSLPELNKNLDIIFNVDKSRRTQQSFYALWYLLFDIPLQSIQVQKTDVRNDLKEIFIRMNRIDSRATFDILVANFKERYSGLTSSIKSGNLKQSPDALSFARLMDISVSRQGTSIVGTVKASGANKDGYSFYRKVKIENFRLFPEEIAAGLVTDNFSGNEFFELKPKILISRHLQKVERLSVGISDEKFIFNSDIFGFYLTRKGFLSKYVAAILASRYILHSFIRTSVKNDENRTVSISSVRDVLIPIIEIRQQVALSRILDYIRLISYRLDIVLFFERILDSLVYELFLNKEFRESDIRIMNYFLDLPNVDSASGSKLELIEDVYNKLISPEHPIGYELLKTLNINSINSLEGIV